MSLIDYEPSSNWAHYNRNVLAQLVNIVTAIERLTVALEKQTEQYIKYGQLFTEEGKDDK